MTHTLLADTGLTKPAVAPELWLLDPATVFLNHGSFGSCPRPVLEYQQALRDHMERQPVDFLVRELEGLLDQARRTLAQFVGAETDDLVLVPNATAGVNTVLRSIRLNAGDELLVTNHEYNACRNALDFVADRERARVVVADVPFPLTGPDEVVSAVLERITPQTRLALVDHVTSQTGLILPVEELARELSARGVDLLVDGAHAPGMLPLNLSTLGAVYYTGNCHKWICAPKSAGFLYVKRSHQAAIRPLAISHGANSPRKDRSRFQIEFGWTGTGDPSAFLAIPKALDVLGALLPGGWPELMVRNRRLALQARGVLCKTLHLELPCPDGMIGSLAALPLPDGARRTMPVSPLYIDPLQNQLREQFSIEVPIIPWPAPPRRILRVSAQLYNSLPQYQLLGQALVASGVC
jgi:isopenicillin-N epimerase